MTIDTSTPRTPCERCGIAVYWRAFFLAFLIAASVLPFIKKARAEDAQSPSLVVLPFEIQDTSGEVGPANRHDDMLARLTTLVRDELSASKLYRVFPAKLTNQAVAAQNSGTYLRGCNGCEIDIAKRLGARAVLVGWIYKVSTLILTLHIRIEDAETGETLYAHVFDFRGDNERAYSHAATAFVRSLAERLAKS